MTYAPETAIGQEVSLPVPLSASQLPNGSSIRIFQGSTLVSLGVTVQNLASAGPSLVKFTPAATGRYTVALADGTLLGAVDVVTRTVQSYVKNLEDEALGSWQWDRTNGTLQLLRQDGSVLANFTVTDTLTSSSRERTL
jgi:hypothetical protein